MTLPANTGPDPIIIRKQVDADAGEISDAIADFAEENKLENDPRFAGEGVRFVPTGHSRLFRSGDTLDIRIVEGAETTSVTFTATMAGLHARGDAYQRGRYIRGGIFAAVFIGAGVAGMTHGVNTGDFIPVLIGVGIGSGAVRRARGEYQSRDEYERKVARALDAVFIDLG
jgi:hypothetical protein